jgi:hypothetical protein
MIYCTQGEHTNHYLTHNFVIGIDCISRLKFNYHTIMVTVARPLNINFKHLEPTNPETPRNKDLKYDREK